MWFTKLCNGDTDLADQPRLEGTREIDREAIIEVIEEDPTLSTEEDKEELDGSTSPFYDLHYRDIRNTIICCGWDGGCPAFK
ncbi:hypothetical protein KIN20_022537 [Parelaphostrongylus tenuis]|uniref:Uncharacterized protein n=1 Tax=Parelaphostrongylus tenuis TaxID=148309 RepID=A0AAD5N689_PARTN|nr:hypothetical protein KIN20_022537 [Parelaphostrongylus tenuis]